MGIRISRLMNGFLAASATCGGVAAYFSEDSKKFTMLCW
jgi:hypothetical protein